MPHDRDFDREILTFYNNTSYYNIMLRYNNTLRNKLQSQYFRLAS